MHCWLFIDIFPRLVSSSPDLFIEILLSRFPLLGKTNIIHIENIWSLLRFFSFSSSVKLNLERKIEFIKGVKRKNEN